MSKTWSTPTSPDEMKRRAGGRRRYHYLRRLDQLRRRMKVFELLNMEGGPRHGLQREIAQVLGVSPSVICRDFQYILTALAHRCRQCGAAVPPPWPRAAATLEVEGGEEEALEVDFTAPEDDDVSRALAEG